MMRCISPLRLSDLGTLLGGRVLNPEPTDPVMTSIVSSGSDALEGSLFIAIRGARADGHDYIDQAFAAGAVAAVVSDSARLGAQPGILVKDGRSALSLLAAHCSGHPSRELLTIGVTGTNGKTTVHWMLHHALLRLGQPSIRIGSLGIAGPGLEKRSGKVVIPGSGDIILTTPDAMEIHANLRRALDAGLSSCVLETSSHALSQKRVADVAYDAGIFTNLSPDHLNYHRDMEDYFKAKVGLFQQLADLKKVGLSPGKAIINTDDPWGQRLIPIAEKLGLGVIGFGMTSEAQVRIGAFDQRFPTSRLKIEFANHRYRLSTPMIGDYNASNLAAAFAGLVALSFEPAAVAQALSGLPHVPGRLESVGQGEFTVLVDYAHTGEGLEKTLKAIRPFTMKRLWVLFGCGGGKDPAKREAMGRTAAQLADCIVLTSDNPRNEDPQDIFRDILKSGCRPEFIEPDRARAIERCLDKADPGDVVLLAGKGHEDYQVIGEKTMYFSDREEVLRWFEARGLAQAKDQG